MSNILILLYVFMIIYNPISLFLPYANYIDDFLCLFLVGCALIKIFSGKLILRINTNAKVLLACLIIFLIGIFSNMIYGYAPSVSAIFRDIMNTFKFFLTYYSGAYLLKNYESYVLKKRMIWIAKCFIIVIFLFAMVSLFIDIGMGSELRYGIRSFKFFYTHYTYLVFNEILLLSTIMCDEKKNYEYYVMSFITLILTLRAKAFIYVAVVLIVSCILYFRRSKKNINLKSILKIRYILPIMVVVYLITNAKVEEYLSWGINNSIRVGMHYEGVKIMLDHFPLGTGFATYGTNLSYSENSIVYSMYNSLNYQNLLSYGYATMSDVYWPSIYAQFGLFGFIVFGIALFYCIKSMLDDKHLFGNVKKSLICVMLYMVVASIVEAVFSNESGVFVSIFIVMLKCFPKNDAIIENRDVEIFNTK